MLNPFRKIWLDRPFHENILQQVLALMVWCFVWILVQHSSSSLNWNTAQEAMLLLGVWAILIGILSWRAPAWTLRILTSIPFAISQLIFMAAAVALGTMILQELKMSEYLNLYEGRWWGVIALFLIKYAFGSDIYRSLWFLSLMSLLSASTLAVAWKRRPYNLPRLGFLLVHISTTIILLGGLVGKFGFVRAFNELREGEPVQAFYKVKGPDPNDWREEYQIPDALRLEKFRVLTHDPEYRLYAFTKPDGRNGFEDNPKSYTVKEGLKARLPLTWKKIEIIKFLSDAASRGEWINDPKAPLFPSIQIMLGLGQPTPLMGYLLADDPKSFRFNDPLGSRFSIVYLRKFTSKNIQSLRAKPPTKQLLKLEFSGTTREQAFLAGKNWDFPTFKIKMIKIHPDFPQGIGPQGRIQLKDVPPALRGPYAEIAIEKPEGYQAIYLSSKSPEFTDEVNKSLLPPGLTLRYVRQGEESINKFLVFSQEDKKARLLIDGQVVKTENVSNGKTIVISPGISATPLAIYDNGVYVPKFESQVPIAEKVSDRSPAIQVKLTDPDSGKIEGPVWLSGKEARPVTFFDGKIGLIYREKDKDPLDFRSIISVLDSSGKKIKEKEISVNGPMIHKGHWFYQSNYNPDDPKVSGIMVVYEPGLYITYFGFFTLILGTVWMFYLKPILQKRMK